MVNINSHFWTIKYLDGSEAYEWKDKWHEINFPLVDYLLMVPKPNSGSNIFCKVVKHPDYALIFRREQHMSVGGIPQGTNYLVGLEPDDDSTQIHQVQAAFREIEYCAKYPGGFRAWIQRNNTMKYSGCFNKIEDDRNGWRFITLSLD